eukprot:gene6639-1184_t
MGSTLAVDLDIEAVKDLWQEPEPRIKTVLLLTDETEARNNGLLNLFENIALTWVPSARLSKPCAPFRCALLFVVHVKPPHHVFPPRGPAPDTNVGVPQTTRFFRLALCQSLVVVGLPEYGGSPIHTPAVVVLEPGKPLDIAMAPGVTSFDDIVGLLGGALDLEYVEPVMNIQQLGRIQEVDELFGAYLEQQAALPPAIPHSHHGPMPADPSPLPAHVPKPSVQLTAWNVEGSKAALEEALRDASGRHVTPTTKPRMDFYRNVWDRLGREGPAKLASEAAELMEALFVAPEDWDSWERFNVIKSVLGTVVVKPSGEKATVDDEPHDL